MSNPFIAEIRLLPFNFAPAGWAFCDGQILPLSQNTALFSLLGTTYGGDGKSNFALPNLQGNAPMHPDQGPGLSVHFLGETGGSETVTLLQSEIPSHNHSLGVITDPADQPAPSPVRSLARSSGGFAWNPTLSQAQMSDSAIGPAGANLPHNNMQPYLTLNFCIALQGIFPSRS